MLHLANAQQGIDITDVAVVIQYGLCRDIPNWRQRGGRGGRDPSLPSLFITLYEPWVQTIDLSETRPDPNDPDHPTKPLDPKKKRLTKQERTGFACIHLIQSDECIRLFIAKYFDDQTSDRVFHLLLYFSPARLADKLALLRYTIHE